MRKIKIISRKYNGQLRDEYDAFLIAEDNNSLQVLVPPGTPCFDHRKGKWIEGEDGVLEIYFKLRGYAVWHMCEKRNPGTNSIYAHIALPATLHGDTLEWTDLDLDYRVHADGVIEPLDEDEFEHNAKAMQYPQGVIANALLAFEEAGTLCRTGLYPFDYQEQVKIYQAAKAQLDEAAQN